MAGLWCVNIGYGRAELADVAGKEQMRQLSYFISGVGVAMPPDEYLPEVESLCRKYGILLHHKEPVDAAKVTAAVDFCRANGVLVGRGGGGVDTATQSLCRRLWS